MKKIFYSFQILFLFAQSNLLYSGELKILCQVTGALKTNSYLIYDSQSRQAALIDPGGKIDTLLAAISKNNLELKFIFITHGHPDHLMEVSDLRKTFPDAKFCLPEKDYKDLQTFAEWALKNYGPVWIAEQAKKNPELVKIFQYDFKVLGEPDIYLVGDQVFKLGSIEINTFLTPGHSLGSICYYSGNNLFSGDVLFYRSVGTITTPHGSKEELIKSVRRLYSIFPDSMKVYPGHRQFTDIGSEKRENKKISATGGELLN